MITKELKIEVVLQRRQYTGRFRNASWLETYKDLMICELKQVFKDSWVETCENIPEKELSMANERNNKWSMVTLIDEVKQVSVQQI